MSNLVLKLTAIAITANLLSACAVAKTTGKIAALPVKAVYKTGELAGKTVYHTGRIAGTGVYKTGELAGKSVYHTGRIAGTGVYETGKFAGKTAVATGKGIYYIGTVPVKITNSALDTSAKVLTLTTQAMDLTGQVVTVSKDIQAMQLDTELKAFKSVKNLISVFVDKKS